MRAFREVGTTPIKRPRCFEKKLSEVSTYTDTQELAPINLRKTSDKTKQNMLTNRTSPGDEFARRSLAVLFDHANENREANKTRVRNLLRQISLDFLAIEWLNSEPRTIENRAYLIGNVLPQVVLGLEYILKEAVQKRLVGSNATEEAVRTEGADRNFNPINRLAEFLMRNNHRYSHFCETSPYVRGLRNTVAKLQEEMFMRSENPLAQLKAAMTKKRQEQAEKQIADQEECTRREHCVAQLFEEFLPPGHETVEASAIQNAIHVFLELALKVPDAVRKCLVPIFDKKVVEEDVKVYTRSEFIFFVMIYAKPLTTVVFDQLMEHLKLCASEYRHTVEKEGKRNLLTKFFVSCDLDHSEILSREKMLNLCDTYFGSAPKEVKVLLRNPRDWPVREYHLRNTRPTASDESVVPANEHKPSEGNKKEETVSPDQNNSAAVDLLENICERENKQDEMEPTIEKHTTEEHHISTVSESEGTANDNYDNDDIEKDTNEEQVNEASEEEQELHTSKEYQKIDLVNNRKATGHTKALDEQTLVNSLSARSRSLNRSASHKSPRNFLYGYNAERLTLLQFLHLMDNFITNTAPISLVQDFIRYLETSYKENDEERLQKSQTKCQNVYEQRMREMIKELFDLLDTDSSGLIEITNVEKVIGKFQNGAAYVEALNTANAKFLNRLHSTRVRTSSMRARAATTHGATISSSGPLPGPISSVPLTAKARSPSHERHKLNYPEFVDLMLSVLCTDDDLLLSEAERERRLTDLQSLIAFVRETHFTRTLEEKLRARTRRTWLRAIEIAGEESMFSMQEVYKTVFQAVAKDAVQFGKGKRVSAHISILQSSTDQNQVALRCVAAVPETEAQQIVNKLLHPNKPNISFEALKTGKLIHIPELTAQSILNVHLWNETRAARGTENNIVDANQISDYQTAHFETGASCVVLPIPNPLRQMIGVLGIDTLAGEYNQAGFEAHELEFYQGVADRLGRAHSLIGMRRLFTQTARSAFEWLAYQLPQLEQITLYYCRDKQPMEAAGTTCRQCVLQRLVSKDQRGPATIHRDAVVIERDENYCMAYLFNVADTSDSSNSTVLGKRHLVYPLRDSEDVTLYLIDLCVGSTNEPLSEPDSEHLINMLGVLSVAYHDLVRKNGLESMDRLVLDECEQQSDANQPCATMTESPVPETVFDQFMQSELWSLQRKITDESFDELATYVNPPPAIVQVVHTCILLILPDAVVLNETQNRWNCYRRLMNEGLEKQLLQFDPSFSCPPDTLCAVENLFIDYTQDDLDRCKSGPAQLLYQWIRCCRTVFYNNLTEPLYPNT